METKNKKQQMILVAVDKGIGPSGEESLEELEELARTAGIDVVGKVIQNRRQFHHAHYVGKGKMAEIKILLDELEADGIICDDELTGSQTKNLSNGVEAAVMDRTMLILDIFASRANTAEGKLQVELASLEYRLAHLVGFGAQMSRIGGGAGTFTRGSGETKLELDRRNIRDRISFLRHELVDLQKNREEVRKRRETNQKPIIALCGYTNAGKSTIMNSLTKANVLAEDKLFATLDTTTRELELPDGSLVLLIDTVGFIEKLPHTLIEAFKATLEELTYADILWHVVDASNIARSNQMSLVYETLNKLGAGKIPVMTIFNKMDLDVERPLPPDKRASDILNISATLGAFDDILEKTETLLQEIREPLELLIPYDEGHQIKFIHGQTQVLKEEHREDGIYYSLYAGEVAMGRLKKYRIEKKD